MSNWIGKIGKHIETYATVKAYIHRPTWGDEKLFVLEDDTGNIITIQSASNFRIGMKWKIDGKVKRHNVFKGQRQTHISNWGLMVI